MRTLKIIIKKEWFDQIARKEKVVEYRDETKFWTSRLYDKNGKKREYDRIEFINGYNKNARRLITRYEGLTVRKGQYLIKIGDILRREHVKG